MILPVGWPTAKVDSPPVFPSTVASKVGNGTVCWENTKIDEGCIVLASWSAQCNV